MENFDRVFDDLTGVYSELENVMGSLYNDIQNNPEDQRSIEMLRGLGNVASRLLASQRDLVESYCDHEFKENLDRRLEEKEMVLSTALSQVSGLKTI